MTSDVGSRHALLIVGGEGHEALVYAFSEVFPSRLASSLVDGYSDDRNL
jgi:hypothetical protein